MASAAKAITLSLRTAGVQSIAQLGGSRSFSSAACVFSEHESRLPRVLRPSMWSSIIPKSWRKSQSPEEAARRVAARAVGAEERRVGVIFLILGIVVGSNAIHLLNIKREMLNYSRQTEAKLAALREVIERVKQGEEVDVKRILGTGDAEHEKEWEQVIKELEETDMLWEGRKKKEEIAAQFEEARQKQKKDARQANSRASTDDSSKSRPAGPTFYM